MLTYRSLLLPPLYAAALLAMSVVNPLPAAAADSAPSQDRFAGTYTFAGGESQRAGVETAIDKAIDGMFFLAKPIARGKLHDKTEIKTSIGFAFAGGKITSTASGVSPATSPDDGSFASYAANSESLRVSQKVNAAGHLIQTFAAPEGTRTNDYDLADGGKLLRVSVSITSGKLPRPVRYVLTYRRN